MVSSKINICYITTQINAYSETFLARLKEGLEGEIFHCYGGSMPFRSLRGHLMNYNTPSVFDVIKKRLGLITCSLAEYYLENYLKINKIHVVIANYGTTGLAVINVTQRLGIPLIVQFLGFDASKFDVVKLYTSHSSNLFKSVAAIVVVSEEMKNDLIKLGAIPDTITKLTCAVPEKFFDNSANLLSNQILAAGRFVEKKAPYLTLLAFQEAQKIDPTLHLKFVGNGELIGVVKDLVKVLSIENVIFAEPATSDELIMEMTKSFCFVQHSKQAENGDKEGTPVAIMEAMAVGLPVVSTRHGGIPDVIIDRVNGLLVNEKDVIGMANAILELAQNRKLAKQIGLNAKQTIIEFYNMQNYYKRWNQLISRVAHGRNWPIIKRNLMT